MPCPSLPRLCSLTGASSPRRRTYDLNTQYDSQYFWVHHSEADTIERMDPGQLNHVAASLAIWAYAVAQLPTLLPRDAPAPPASAPNNAAPGNVGAIAGGVGGGLVILALAAFVTTKLGGVRGVRERLLMGGGAKPASTGMYARLAPAAGSPAPAFSSA